MTDEAVPLESWGRIRRHLYWARTQGVGKLIEEDELDPLDRWRTARAKGRWVRAHGVSPGQAQPVFLLGAQRSGTNMMVRGLDRDPSVEVHNENDSRCFSQFALRFDAVPPLLAASRSRLVLFKPLCDSHRAADLLAMHGARSPKVLWAWRDVDGRVRSAVSKFGDSNRRALTAIVAGERSRWEAGGLTDADIDLLRSLSVAELSAESASALFWYLRNDLYFRQELDRRDDVLLVSYGDMVADPMCHMTSICDFLGFNFSPALVEHIDARAAGTRRLDLDPRVRQLCDELTSRLTAASVRPTTSPDT